MCSDLRRPLMQFLAEMSETVFQSGGGCGFFTFWFGCNAIIRLPRGSRSCQRKKNAPRRSLKRPRVCESDAKTHRTPKALRAKSIADGCCVSRKLWECRRVLASLCLVREI